MIDWYRCMQILYFPADDPCIVPMAWYIRRDSKMYIYAITHEQSIQDLVVIPARSISITMRTFSWSLALCFCALGQISYAKSLWSTVPASASDIIRTAYPLGNGRLGALSFGPAGSETLNLNVDSLWSGGPFEVAVS